MQNNLIAGLRRILCAGLPILSLAALGQPAGAQSPVDKYPEKPIKIIVPFPPGGSVDILARVVGQRMQENWGQPVIVESRAGASTMIGTAAAAKAEADGYTLIIVVSNHATNPALRSNMPYDALKDFRARRWCSMRIRRSRRPASRSW